MPVLLLSLCSLIPSDVSAPSADLSELERSLLDSELALELSLRLAGSVSDSALVVPDFDRGAKAVEAPEVDGTLDDSGWDAATSFPWTVVGNARARQPFSWRIEVLLAGGSMFLSGETVAPFGARGVLNLDSGPERIVLRFEGTVFTARFESSTSTARLDRPGFAFAATRDDGGGIRWELRVPRENKLWPPPLGALRPLRLSASRGLPGELFVSPAYRLIPAEAAVRVETIARTEERDRFGSYGVSATIRVYNHSPDPLIVRDGLRDRFTVPAAGEADHRFEEVFGATPEGLGWDFEVGPHGQRLGVGTAFLAADRLVEDIDRSLLLCRGNLERAPGDTDGLKETLGTLEGRLADTRRNRPEKRLERLEPLRVQCRQLQRRTFFATLTDFPDRILFVKRFRYRSGPFYRTYLHDMPGGGVFVWTRQSGVVRNLTPRLPADASVRDVTLRPDGERAVFARRRREGGTNLWEVDLAERTGGRGDAARALTSGSEHDIEPCVLGDDRIVFGSTRHGARNPIDDTRNYCLHIADASGGDIRRLSYNNLVDFTPTVLADGRILFLRWSHEDRPGNFINSLWTIYPDGRALGGFFGMNRAGLTIEPQPIPGSTHVVCLETGATGHWRSPQVGDLTVVDSRLGAVEFAYRIAAERGGFKNPYPIGPDSFLVAYGWTDTRWGIYVCDRHGNRELLYRDPEISCFNPLPVRPRDPPGRIPDLTAAEPDRLARLLVQDVYEGLPGVAPGTIASLRVVAVPDRPATASRSAFSDQRVPLSIAQRMLRVDLGTVPVEPDGSVYFEVPSRTNLFFQLLDAKGRLIQTMRDTVHFAPGEKRACIGCHEPRRDAPSMRARTTLIALGKVPARPDRIDAPQRPSFLRDVQPILDRHCVRCHDAADPAGGAILSADASPFFTLSYETLLRGSSSYNRQIDETVPGGTGVASAVPEGERSAPLVAPLSYRVTQITPRSTGSATSQLLEWTDGRHHGVRFSAAEVRRLARWMDFNVPFYDDWESGRVPGSAERRLLSRRSETVLRTVMRIRCRGCHLPPDLFRGAAVNMSRPELSPVLRAPLARVRGGTGLCRWPVFNGREDAAYGAILNALEADRRHLDEKGDAR